MKRLKISCFSIVPLLLASGLLVQDVTAHAQGTGTIISSCDFCKSGEVKIVSKETCEMMQAVYRKAQSHVSQLKHTSSMATICQETNATDAVIKEMMRVLLLPDWTSQQVSAFLVDMNDYRELRYSMYTELRANAWKGFINAPNNLRTNIVILEKAKKLLSIGLSVSYLDAFSSTLRKIKNRSVPDVDIDKIAEYALQARQYTDQHSRYNIEVDLFKQLDVLAASSNFLYIERLKIYLSGVQLLQNIHDNPGNLEQLNEAVKLVKNGDNIILEGVDALRGDIVNVSKYESIQFKAITGESESTVRINLNAAAEQFLTEPVTSGYKKIVKLKILNSVNPYYSYSALSLKNKLQASVDQNIQQRNNSIVDNLRDLELIIIENANGIHKFKLINSLIIIK